MLETNLLLPWQDTSTLSTKEALPIYGICANAITKSGFKNEETDDQEGHDCPEELKKLALTNHFTGQVGETLCTPQGALIGLGDKTDPFAWAAGASAFPDGKYYITNKLDDQLAPLATLSWLLGAYRFDRYKTKQKSSAQLIAPKNIDVVAVKQEAQATSFVRDLVNTPTNDMLPKNLEQAASDLCKDYNATMTSIVGDDLLHQNFPMVHAVGRASSDAPRLLDIKWQPDTSTPSSKRRRVTIIGKGVCFDNGGLNIKGGAGMALMKKDMGGAANSLGLAQMIMAANLDIELRVILPVVENAIDGNAFRPSDVLDSRKGLTVEIGNTDAEGRLILADALTYATEKENDNPPPDLLISLATLTGAARVALGPEVVPFYCDDADISAKMATASQQTFDPAWQMPLWDRYTPNLNSSVANLNNISGNSFAGSIIAALFLKKFVAQGTPWMHFDIYAWRPQSEPGRPKGGEAQAIRALFSMIKEHYTPS